MAVERSPPRKGKADDVDAARYLVIDGERYDRRVLEKAEESARDGVVSFPEAKELWELAGRSSEQGGVPEEIAARTLRRALSVHRFTDKASAFLEPLLRERRPWKTSPWKYVDGVKYDRALLERVEGFAADGLVSYPEAKQAWEEAHEGGHGQGGGQGGNGKAAAELRRRTLEHTLSAFKYTEKAAAFLRRQLQEESRPKSLFKQISGERFDRELLEKAEAFAKDGQISFAEANQLWACAKDGKGLRDIERKTLLRTMQQFKYTEKAAAFLRQALHEQRGSEAAAVAAAAAGEAGKKRKRASERVTVRWTWTRRTNFLFPSFPVVQPRRQHRFSLVLCHPLGCQSTFFLGPSGLVKDLLVRSREIRNHCRIICPGAQKIGWGKQWFRYRSNKGGTTECHADVISRKDLEQTVQFVSSVVDKEVARLGSADRVGISGYSQGGCVSLAVGLAARAALGLVISQRGMLMQQTMDLHQEQTWRQQRRRVFLTAGAKDDVYLLANQIAAKSWLERKGCQVRLRSFPSLDHYDSCALEHTAIRRACLQAFQSAAASPPRTLPRSSNAGSARRRGALADRAMARQRHKRPRQPLARRLAGGAPAVPAVPPRPGAPALGGAPAAESQPCAVAPARPPPLGEA